MLSVAATSFFRIMSILDRIESLLSSDAGDRPDWNKVVARAGKIDPAAIDVGEGQELFLLSEGHAAEIEARIDAIQAAADDAQRPLTLDETSRITAMQDVLLRGAYVLRAGEQISAPMHGQVIVTESEAEAARAGAQIQVRETAALRGATVLGRLLSAEEIAEFEAAEARSRGRRRRL